MISIHDFVYNLGSVIKDSPVLDSGNSDSLDFHVSWNKNPKKD